MGIGSVAYAINSSLKVAFVVRAVVSVVFVSALLVLQLNESNQGIASGRCLQESVPCCVLLRFRYQDEGLHAWHVHVALLHSDIVLVVSPLS
jgi:hypothetical protein